ncbi:hypothetical protein [Paenibacillus sp. NPDC058071]|uniref:hypothetical protein n=1 Tax=Paenibacillus sp. NPDC058071 TaxID=3346326 RepID=UPI0036DCE510
MHPSFARKKLVLPLVALLCAAVLFAAPVSAAAFEFTVTARTAFDKMTGDAGQASGDKLKKQYAELQALQKQDLDWDTKVNGLHYRNEESLIAVKKSAKEIDAAKVARLETELTAARKKYEPVFKLYDSLKQQHTAAKKLKSKTAVAYLEPQLDAAKFGVTLAKEDLKKKEAALKAAKTAATAARKKVADTLSGADSLNVKIKAAKSTISTTKKHFATEGAVLNQAVRKADVTASSGSFIRMISYQKQIIEQKQKIHVYETQIEAVIAKAKALIP